MIPGPEASQTPSSSRDHDSAAHTNRPFPCAGYSQYKLSIIGLAGPFLPSYLLANTLVISRATEYESQPPVFPTTPLFIQEPVKEKKKRSNWRVAQIEQKEKYPGGWLD